MFRIASCLLLLLSFAGVSLASRYGYYKPKKNCYQCQYVPPRETSEIIYEEETFEVKMPVTKVHCWYNFEFEGKSDDIYSRPEADCSRYEPTCKHETSYDVVTKRRQVPKVVKKKSAAGGFGPCKGPITPYSAKRDGVDAWQCHSNCYTRTDSHGRITRGCYKDELHIDPNRLGCHKQAGVTYCFCKENLCNYE